MPYGKGTYGSKVGRPKKKRGAATAQSKLGRVAKKRKVLNRKLKKTPKRKIVTRAKRAIKSR